MRLNVQGGGRGTRGPRGLIYPLRKGVRVEEAGERPEVAEDASGKIHGGECRVDLKRFGY